MCAGWTITSVVNSPIEYVQNVRDIYNVIQDVHFSSNTRWEKTRMKCFYVSCNFYEKNCLVCHRLTNQDFMCQFFKVEHSKYLIHCSLLQKGAPIALERKHICSKSNPVIKMHQQLSTSLKGSTRDPLHTFSCYSKFYFYRQPTECGR